jgi:hypothetical protein
MAGYENYLKAHERQAVMVFNHVSYTDGIALGAYFLPCGIAKASVADIPFFGTFTKVGCQRSLLSAPCTISCWPLPCHLAHLTRCGCRLW